jgi:hypothetical protein
MSGAYLPRALRDRVARSAKYRCGYCLTQCAVVGTPLEMDHILPESLGGPTEEENLWLSCTLCNNYKGNRITTEDPLTGRSVRIFNPRSQSWNEHFAWTESETLIIGLTDVGRATVVALNLNRASLVHSRKAWVAAGWHPPRD